jgi:ABC-type branched-subunit amino acid transport system substrate-binding protein
MVTIAVSCSIITGGDVVAGAASSGPGVSPQSSLQCASGLGTGAPGVTPTQINVAAISSLTGPISAGFSAVSPGAQAYFDTVNAHGGVNGRKINLAYNLNDEGTGSRFETETHTAIDQDHAFAVLVSSYWFTPTYFAATCTPTYGFNVTGNWATSPNLFAAGGSVQTYTAGAAQGPRYLIKKVHAKAVGVLAYGVSSSADACQADANNLKKGGVNVAYEDLKVTPLNPNITPDVQRMQSSGVDMVLTCMTVNGNIAMAKTLKEYGSHAKMLFFTVINQSVLDKNANVLQGAYYTVESVPALADQKYPGVYPGVKAYQTAMQKYEPAAAGDNNAVLGWESATLLVAGIKAAGKDPTQAKVVAATNKLTAFTYGGLRTPTNWQRTHTLVTAPYCNAFVQVQGTKLEPVLGQDKQVFVCFSGTVKHPTPVPTKKGTPGPHVSG